MKFADAQDTREQVTNILRAGVLVALPIETVYMLGVSARVSAVASSRFRRTQSCRPRSFLTEAAE
jgi:tRNA A37 threonylcarbamoyladenosine synthetase subunit TsaC/SUA5/YrdC